MYQLLLTRKYLSSKVMPLLASLAVLLCTAMVLVIWSVMGGFLDMLVRSGRTMTGDVIVAWPNAGFGHYEDLVRRLEADEMVEAAAPVIESFALIGLPDGRQETVMLRGVDGPSYGRVTAFRDILWWKKIDRPLPKDKDLLDPRNRALKAPGWDAVYEQGLSLTVKDRSTGAPTAALVMGIEVSGFNDRTEHGFYNPMKVFRRTPDGGHEVVDLFMPVDGTITVNTIPLDSRGTAVETVSRVLPVANEFMSGLFDLDNRLVLVRLDMAQEMLKLGKSDRVVDDPSSPDGYRIVGENPARVTHVLVRGKGDLGTFGAANPLKRRVESIYEQFAEAHRGEVPGLVPIVIMTWEDQNRTMIGAVRKETALVLSLFSLVSLVAVILVLTIFWAMISDKTRDIGIMRALGASKAGIAWVWLMYGLAIGVVGSSLGMVTAYVIVTNINPIHEWMGSAMGLTIWDPAVYYFFTIPNRVDPSHAAIVWAGGVLSCFVGAFIPAVRAANMRPVRALRFE